MGVDPGTAVASAIQAHLLRPDRRTIEWDGDARTHAAFFMPSVLTELQRQLAPIDRARKLRIALFLPPKRQAASSSPESTYATLRAAKWIAPGIHVRLLARRSPALGCQIHTRPTYRLPILAAITIGVIAEYFAWPPPPTNATTIPFIVAVLLGVGLPLWVILTGWNGIWSVYGSGQIAFVVSASVFWLWGFWVGLVLGGFLLTYLQDAIAGASLRKELLSAVERACLSVKARPLPKAFVPPPPPTAPPRGAGPWMGQWAHPAAYSQPAASAGTPPWASAAGSQVYPPSICPRCQQWVPFQAPVCGACQLPLQW